MSRDYGDGLVLPCRAVDPEVMFPDSDQDLPNNHPAFHVAKQVCRDGCPIRLQCALGAIQRREPIGVWGAMTKKDRDAYLKRQQRAGGQVEQLPLAIGA